ncbi:hypothetical protein T11_2622 [Trichinella zimbabwensis]|uniref:Uncharacterized protein n=1 Tax=Trichinella zimbabwensis TaxID=268475 RepID=A0A0V1GVW9_9BILA|nr:hypothetical protein T11_2622 [Trichinella zimbabwensis]
MTTPLDDDQRPAIASNWKRKSQSGRTGLFLSIKLKYKFCCRINCDLSEINNYLLDVKAQVKKELIKKDRESSDFEKIIGEIMKVNNVTVSALSNVEAFKFASVGLIYDFAWWRKFVVVLAPFRCNNCFHCSTLDPGHLCSIIRMKAYEKAASRAECSEESSVD